MLFSIIIAYLQRICNQKVLIPATPPSIYVSGRTRSGKTNFLVQQAVIRAKAGSRVIIFDQTGAFSREELTKHLPRSLVEEVFFHWEISKEGLPVDLLSLENCSSLVEKKNRVWYILDCCKYHRRSVGKSPADKPCKNLCMHISSSFPKTSVLRTSCMSVVILPRSSA